ncbi:DUF2487 family protein [Mangrovibacillus cuniculi]|uniref:DUF2487 family protein n=1 Tax=Mangrovibacillus cuniculi TaxID=2593652 RepID=A0A7S8HFD1_9BACI|nr:DUF2487 family protein [Mangrovibacillus cuniculi]QPC46688.1 DUF2487 family protein [Mangrovibacillus cuniculi]
MLWIEKDVTVFNEQKEYIDTLVVPLAPISFGANMKRTAEQGEFVQRLTTHMEKQFRGRIFVLPTQYYAFSTKNEEKYHVIEQVKKAIEGSSFRHILWITSDKEWKDIDLVENETLLHIPSLTLEHMSEGMKYEYMENQVKELLPELIEVWKKIT